MSVDVVYKDLSIEDLNSRLASTGDDLKSAKINFRLGKFKKTSEFLRLRKEIARIKTHIRSRSK